MKRRKRKTVKKKLTIKRLNRKYAYLAIVLIIALIILILVYLSLPTGEEIGQPPLPPGF